MQVNMLEAKTQLSKLVEAALRGEEVLIANRGKAVVRLLRLDGGPERRWGGWVGQLAPQAIDRAFAPADLASGEAGLQPGAARPAQVVEAAPASAAPRKTIARRVAVALKSP